MFRTLPVAKRILHISFLDCGELVGWSSRC